jgi:hypothetical protein
MTARYEIPQFTPVAVPAVFGVRADFSCASDLDRGGREPAGGERLSSCACSAGPLRGVPSPDEKTRELIFNDPWPGRFV